MKTLTDNDKIYQNLSLSNFIWGIFKFKKKLNMPKLNDYFVVDYHVRFVKWMFQITLLAVLTDEIKIRFKNIQMLWKINFISHVLSSLVRTIATLQKALCQITTQLLFFDTWYFHNIQQSDSYFLVIIWMRKMCIWIFTSFHRSDSDLQSF